MTDPIPPRIASKIDFTGPCWEWIASLNWDDYGQTWYEGRQWRIHRLIWTLLVGPIPTGLELDHLCRNPPCCNPDHLEPVTHTINVLRGFGVGVLHPRKTRCINGHDFTSENTWLDKHGWKHCRSCRREALRRFRSRQSGRLE